MTRRPLLAILAISAILVACGGSAALAPQDAGGVPLPEKSGAEFSAATSAPARADDKGPGTVTGDPTYVVRTGTMSLLVKDVSAATAAARTAIESMGGHISASSAANDGEKPFASATYRIPVARYDDALAALRPLGIRVVNEQSGQVEVTGQVADLEARLANLRVTESALQAIMDKATKIADVLEVQAQLTEVRGQIEQLVAQKIGLVDQAAMSTLSVDFSVDIPATTTVSQGWDAGKIIDDAVSQLIGLAQDLAGVLIVLAIVGGPVVIVLGLLGLFALIAWRLVRRLRRPKATIA